VLCPSFVRTGLIDALIAECRLALAGAAGEMPLGRMASPAEMTGALYFPGSTGAAAANCSGAKTGKVDVAVPLRNWTRPQYGKPDVLYVWPQQRSQHTFNLLYTADHYKDAKNDPATAETMYGFIDIDLVTGKATLTDFAPVTEVYFSGGRSTKDPNIMFGVLNRLAKYDIKEKKLIGSAALDHSYYCFTINKAGDKIYLAGTFNTVAVYNPDTMQKMKDIHVPGGDMAITTAQIFTR
jgi:hypothetical protein